MSTTIQSQPAAASQSLRHALTKLRRGIGFVLRDLAFAASALALVASMCGLAPI